MTDLIKRMRGWRCLDFAAAADMLSEASDALERTQWQPIETAPKDGTRIMMIVGGVVKIGKWYDDDKDRGQQPTHWMPLPPVPE